MIKKNKIAQIWIETVLYTLIGLALIGIVLAVATPKITQSRDRILVEQTITSLNSLDGKINEVLDRGPGNVRRIPEFTMRRGEMYVNSSGDNIIFVLSDITKYSEPGAQIKSGAVTLVTKEEKRKYSVILMLDYSGTANITFERKDILKKFNPATTPYSLSMENLGSAGQGNVEVSISETSGR
ncbi:hypothetical protein HYV50_05725 [Candidatus Pacearchaeota archaeon]|nr:hypothetical protein [Candidatus Pacearchaeota archaeon]